MGNFKPGLCSVSFRDRSPEEILSAMRDAGLEYIEWGSDVHAPADDGGKLRSIARLAGEYGIACSSYGTYFRLGHTPMAELGDHIAAARILGTDVLRLWCGIKGSADHAPAERDELFRCCRDAAGIAEAEGVTLAMECHLGTYADSVESVIELMNGTDSPAFRMYWQPNQFRTVEENLTAARAIAPYTVNIHAFNWVGNEKLPLEDAVPLWRNYLREFGGDHTVLLEFMPDDRLESLPAEAAALKRIIG